MGRKPKDSGKTRLKALLEALNLSQTELAARVNTAPSTLSLILNGRRAIAKGMAARIASATGCGEDWLLTGAGEMFPQAPPASAFDEARAAGASTLVSAIWARYTELDPKEKAVFNEILDKVLAEPIREQVNNRLKTFLDGGGAAVSINQIGDNNNASIK